MGSAALWGCRGASRAATGTNQALSERKRSLAGTTPPHSASIETGASFGTRGDPAAHWRMFCGRDRGRSRSGPPLGRRLDFLDSGLSYVVRLEQVLAQGSVA